MKISIITVSFNAATTIADTLDSVARQTYGDIEHILVDGGSTDKTLEIAKRHGKHLTHLISEPDKGIYDAMNKGIRLATGEVVGLLNADDIYFDNSIVSTVKDCMEAGQLDALYGDVLFFSDDNLQKPKRRYRSNHFRPDRIASGWMPAHPTLFLRKKVYDEVGLFKTDYQIAGDFEFIARAFHDGDLHYQYLPEILVKMRIGGVSTGGWMNSVLLNKEVFRACKENGIKTNMMKILSKYPRKILELSWRH